LWQVLLRPLLAEEVACQDHDKADDHEDVLLDGLLLGIQSANDISADQPCAKHHEHFTSPFRFLLGIFVCSCSNQIIAYWNNLVNVILVLKQPV